LRSLALKSYNLISESLDWFYPVNCINCGKVGFRICQDCQSQIKLITNPICTICGTPTKTSGVCSLCRRKKPNYRLLRSWAVFEGPVQKAIHRIKYKNDLTLGKELASLMINYVKDLCLPIDSVIPVPLGEKRRKERGYNQAGLIAYPLALEFGWNFLPDGLIRCRETESQVGLNAMERHENVRNAFTANPKKVAGKKILLIDDVATTGATISSCTEALKAGGALDVFAITLARAKAKHDLSVI